MVNSQALRLVPSRNESRWFHALNRVSCTRSSARSRSPQSDTANARRLVISPTRDSRRLSDTFRRKLFVSASLEVFQKLEQTIGDWLSRNFVEHGTQMAADMGLQIGRQTLFRGERCALAAFRLLESWSSRRSLASAGVPFSLPGPQSSPIRRGSLPKRRIRSIPCVQKRAQPQVVPGSRETFLAPTAFKHTVTRVSSCQH